MQVLMQGVVAGALVRWLADEPDWAAASYEGEGTPTLVALSGGPPQGVNVEEAIETAISGAITFLPYRIERALRTGKSYGALSAGGTGSSLFVNPAGTKLFVLRASGATGDRIRQYTLNTPGDLLSATYDGGFSHDTEDTVGLSLTFNSSGTRMYLAGNTGDAIYQYNLGTAWEIVSDVPTYAGSVSVSGQTTAPKGLLLSPDGTKLLVTSAGSLFQYPLSVPDEIIGGSLGSPISLSVTGQVGARWANGLDETPGGMLIYATADNTIRARACPTPYSISGSSVDGQRTITTTGTISNVYDLHFVAGGTKVWLLGANEIHEYYTSAAVPAL